MVANNARNLLLMVVAYPFHPMESPPAISRSSDALPAQRLRIGQAEGRRCVKAKAADLWSNDDPWLCNTIKKAIVNGMS